jgi:hypothetical protein
MIFLTGGVLTAEAESFVAGGQIVVDKPFSPRSLRALVIGVAAAQEAEERAA